MEEFIGRHRELEVLNRIYYHENVKTCMMYGRRRIGKTCLLRKFVNDKRSLYIEFVRGAELRNVNRIADILAKEFNITEGITDLYLALRAIRDICSQEKTVVVFDELPYLIHKNDAAASELQHFVDWIRMYTDSMVVVCGSSVRMIDAIKGDQPLFGRFAFRIDMDPMRIEDVQEFHPTSRGKDLLSIYLTIGGIPTYHSMFGDIDFRSMIDRYVLEKSASIGYDVLFDLQVELGSMTDNALMVLDALSSGKSSYSEIADATGLGDTTLSKCLNCLSMMRIVSECTRLPERGRTSKYIISDMFMSFYFKIIDRYHPISLMEKGSVYDSLHQLISSHLGRSFELYCRNLVARSYPCTDIGCWWGKAPRTGDTGEYIIDSSGKVETESVDIDLVAVLRKGNQRIDLFGECKFAGRPMDIKDLEVLQSRVAEVAEGRNVRYALFSASGFDRDLEDCAEAYGAYLFGLPELLGEREPPKII